MNYLIKFQPYIIVNLTLITGKKKPKTTTIAKTDQFPVF